ncbi:MAG: efflux RND transporter periplasmic adaptor subunit [Tannerellaceae bacterium]|nr:efflux RND transporter periplasmic adaptor subunit [Tannerellaceae bacterium]
MKTIKKLAIGLLVVLLIIGGVMLFRGRSAAKGLRIEETTVTRNTLSNFIVATGTVEPVISVEVGTQVSGIIDKIYVDFNSVVKKGQVIAEMDKITLRAEQQSQEATLASNKAEFEYQERNYQRYKQLFDEQLISSSDFETATYNYQVAKSSYQRAQADMVRVKQNLEYATITSPIDGVVTNRAVEEGQTVAAGFSTPTLFTIANDLTQMRVIGDVDEAGIGQVEEGQKVRFTVDAYPDDVFEGEVTQVRLEATVESNVVTYEVIISAYNPELKLKPGLTATVQIYTLEHPDVLTIPSRALRFIPDPDILSSMKLTVSDVNPQVSPGQQLVWQKVGSTLQPKAVTTGITSSNMTEILGGLSEGETIIVDVTADLPATNGNGATERSPFAPGPRGRR